MLGQIYAGSTSLIIFVWAKGTATVGTGAKRKREMVPEVGI